MAKRITIEADDRILRNKDLDVITGLSRTTRWRLERAGNFPARRQLSKLAVGWLKSEIDVWMNGKDLAAAA